MRNFGNPYIDPTQPVASLRSGTAHAPLPAPTGKPPYRLDINTVLPIERLDAIRRTGAISFHIVGDTGGSVFPIPQHIVASHLEQQLTQAAFLYIVGDITYYTGDIDNYHAQFYAPYEHYTAPIFSIPGNHDGTTKFLLSATGEPSLTAWMRTFCAPRPTILPEAGNIKRDAMTQPHCYWTLLTPYATIIGLYSNTPEGGYLSDEQYVWFVGELRAADINKAIIVTVHHSPYSLDTSHGNSDIVQTFLDNAFDEAQRAPAAVLSGHTHNYQRFTRYRNFKHIPYLVVGTGGYFDLYNIKPQPPKLPYNITADLTLESYQTDRHGFMMLTVDKTNVIGQYFTVPKPWELWANPAILHDSFTLNWRANILA